MATNFAALEQRTNAAVMRTLCDCGGHINDVPFSGMLDSGFAGQSFDGYGSAGNSAQVTVDDSVVPTPCEGLPLVITSGRGLGTYRIGTAQPDGTGLVTLHLLLQTNPT